MSTIQLSHRDLLGLELDEVVQGGELPMLWHDRRARRATEYERSTRTQVEWLLKEAPGFLYSEEHHATVEKQRRGAEQRWRKAEAKAAEPFSCIRYEPAYEPEPEPEYFWKCRCCGLTFSFSEGHACGRAGAKPKPSVWGDLARLRGRG